MTNDASETSYTIDTGIIEGTSYDIRVTAYNIVGGSNPSIAVRIIAEATISTVNPDDATDSDGTTDADGDAVDGDGTTDGTDATDDSDDSSLNADDVIDDIKDALDGVQEPFDKDRYGDAWNNI